MKFAAQPRTAAVEIFPPAYQTLWFLESIEMRCHQLQPSPFLRRVLSANHLIRPTQIIREHLTPHLVIPLELRFLCSRLFLGENTYACLL